MSRTVALRESSAFLALTYALALAIAIALPHAGINRMLSVLAPITSVIIITFALTPRGERRRMWRDIGLGRSGRSVWLIALVVPMLLLAMAYGTALVLGVAELKPLDLTPAGAADWVANLVVSFVVSTGFILGEEIGWRGYLLPRVQQLTGKRRAAVATGLFHGCFHLPLILIATTYDQYGSRWIVAPAAVLTIAAGGVFYAYLWVRSASVWPVAIAHNAANTMFTIGAGAVVARSADDLAYVAGESGLATMASVVIVAGILLATAKVWRRQAQIWPSRRSSASSSVPS
ncbi:MAG TPA: CPBP family intramembrane glutamic endopeptidase [Aeromicrobium sp.]|nr:CPBP family intramembrane glutamic endopeptidase [Aeromicrobium sp.]